VIPSQIRLVVRGERDPTPRGRQVTDLLVPACRLASGSRHGCPGRGSAPAQVDPGGGAALGPGTARRRSVGAWSSQRPRRGWPYQRPLVWS